MFRGSYRHPRDFVRFAREEKVLYALQWKAVLSWFPSDGTGFLRKDKKSMQGLRHILYRSSGEQKVSLKILTRYCLQSWNGEEGRKQKLSLHSKYILFPFNESELMNQVGFFVTATLLLVSSIVINVFTESADIKCLLWASTVDGTRNSSKNACKIFHKYTHTRVHLNTYVCMHMTWDFDPCLSGVNFAPKPRATSHSLTDVFILRSEHRKFTKERNHDQKVDIMRG